MNASQSLLGEAFIFGGWRARRIAPLNRHTSASLMRCGDVVLNSYDIIINKDK